MSTPAIQAIEHKVAARVGSPAFQAYVQNLLLELCRVDTTPSPDIARLQRAEDCCFRLLERELAQLTFPEMRLERQPISAAIQRSPHYSQLHYTRTPEQPEGLGPDIAYANRSNLVCVIPGARIASSGIALNAHIDVVAPYLPPRAARQTVFGRGACDDKGPLVAIVAALKILSEVLGQAGLRWKRNIVAMFVIDEESGGNGSLSLALNRELKRFYDSVLVAECTHLSIHPANRGAVWYRAEITPPVNVSAFEMSAFINEELEKEGAAIRAESRHPLFPQRPVQTCHGIIGPYGEHPSRICGEVSFTIDFPSQPDKPTRILVEDCLQAGLSTYTGLYGDKTRTIDPRTRKPLVARHYHVRRMPRGFRVDVHGATGHMGAIRERDGAITKMAHLVRSLVLSKPKLTEVGGSPQLRLCGHAPGAALVCEGGQGFVPTHSLDEVMSRLHRAAQRGAANCLAHLGVPALGAQSVKVTCDKLHNVAFDGNPGSRTMKNAIAAAKACGLWKNQPVEGWTVSCDARLFAVHHQGMPVLTFGPGQLAFAHSDHEQISLKDLCRAVEFLSLFLLRQAGVQPKPVRVKPGKNIRR